MDMMIHQKYTAKSITAPSGGAPGMVLRTAGSANKTVTAPVTTAAVSTYSDKNDDDDDSDKNDDGDNSGKNDDGDNSGNSVSDNSG